MDVARLNFSHGTREEHRQLCALVRSSARRADRAVAVLADLQGSRVRFGAFRDGSATLVTGAEFVLTTEPVLGSAARASTSDALLPRAVGVGDEIIAGDGMVRLAVVAVDGTEIRCRVVQGGVVGDHKGLNLPGVHLSAPALTAKDVEDLRCALAAGVDLVALSFVRDPSDVESVRAVMDEAGARVPVLAKLEKPEAVARMDEIVAAFDGLMVARGDLGIELPLAQVPVVQKRAVQAAREQAKPVIVATQMLESMISAPQPTRAEVSDVANAVLDGTDGVMLSAETSVGRWPTEAVTFMHEVIVATECALIDEIPLLQSRPTGRGEAVTQAAAAIGSATSAAALVAFTRSGTTARRLSALRHEWPLLVLTPDPLVRRQLALSWGVESFVSPPVATTDEMIGAVDRVLRDRRLFRPGDTVVVVAGTPAGELRGTNTIRVHTVR